MGGKEGGMGREREYENEDVFIFDDPNEQQTLLALWFGGAAVTSEFSQPSPEPQWFLVCGFWVPKG